MSFLSLIAVFLIEQLQPLHYRRVVEEPLLAWADFIQSRFDAGEYSLLHATQIKPDALPGGASCTLRRYTADIPAGAQTAQLKLSLSGNSCKVYDYALVML